MKQKSMLALWYHLWVVTLILLCCGRSVVAEDQTAKETVRWAFKAADGGTPTDVTGDLRATLHGNYRYVPGASGEALRFDGYTTSMVVPAADIPAAGVDGFTVSAWVALNTYPWNWVPFADQQKERQAGYYLGLDAFGHVSFQASINGQWRSVTTEEIIPLKRWTQVTASYRADHGQGLLSIHVNGSKLCELRVTGQYSPSKADLLVGRVRQATLPFPEAEVKPANPIWYSLDGDVDELTFTARGMSEKEVSLAYEAVKAPSGEVLPWPRMPSGPVGPGRFGAYYTHLNYEDGWDRLRRTGEDSDVVIRFDNSPVRMVFWQGLNYVPAWVTGDDKWYTDEFLEVWDAGCPDHGDCEPMSDKQARFSRVNIVESNNARAVVHWRYALVEAVKLKGAWADARSEWFDWADEYWTVYPDGIAVRKQVLHSSNVHAVHEWQETIVLHEPGHSPEDDIQDAAITLANMQGETKTYTWEPNASRSFKDPVGPPAEPGIKAPNIQMVNLRSVWKPFQVVPPEGASADFYNNEKSYFEFECWNHWPVAQIASSDRPCVSNDRPSHTSLSHLFWKNSAETEDTATKLLLDGLTIKAPATLLPVARSWIAAPALQLERNSEVTAHYDQAQRAYVLDGATKAGRELRMTLLASGEQPAYHPALLVPQWGDDDVHVLVNGKVLPPALCRVTHLEKIDQTDLLLWLELESEKPVQIRLVRKKRRAS